MLLSNWIDNKHCIAIKSLCPVDMQWYFKISAIELEAENTKVKGDSRITEYFYNMEFLWIFLVSPKGMKCV